jgi:FAD/FMN-containing dehydrogenase
MKRLQLSRRLLVQIGAITLGIIALYAGKRGYDLATAPTTEKPCDFTYPLPTEYRGVTISYDALQTASFTVAQIGGTINDASCLNQTPIFAIAHITSEEDIRAALQFAEAYNLTITPAGQRHSMGGQSFSRGGLVLDMHGLNSIQVDTNAMTMTVGSGATWKEIQAMLDPMGLAVLAMQSINLFTVGGTISVNAHGIAHDPGQIGSTIQALRIALADGTIVRATPTENSELFQAAIGGYGLVGIIVDAELAIVQNDTYEWKTDYIDYQDFADFYTDNVVDNPNVGLMYARLSIAPGSYLKETAVHRYLATTEPVAVKPLQTESTNVWLKRLIFNISKTGEFGRWVRWTTEKYLEPGYHTCITRNSAMSGTPEEICVATRNQKMNQSMEYLKSKTNDTNILNEYFIPLEHTTEFIDGLRNIVTQGDVNLLNVTLRIVTKDTVSSLPYAKDDRIAYVLYFNQSLTPDASKKLQSVTSDLIDLATSLGGTFYLPYQLYYTDDQLRKAYPEVDAFFAIKKKVRSRDTIFKHLV